VVISGEDASFLCGAQADELRLYSCLPGGCRAVPVQVDKVDTLGRYVFPQEVNRGRDGTALDANDEISFMAGDAGDRRPPGWRPGGAERGAEIGLRDPLDGGAAWLYLFEQPGSAAPGTGDYVSYSYDGLNTVIRSPQFELNERDDLFGYDRMRMSAPGGGLGPDVLDRQRTGLEARIAGNASVSLSVPQSLVSGRDIAVIDGPVRVIRDQVVSVHLGELSFDVGTEYFIRYYRCGQNNSVSYQFPVSLKDVVQSLSWYWSLDFTPQVIGSSYIDPNQPRPIMIQDQAQKETPNDAPHFWWGIYGEQGAVLQALDLDDDLLEFFTCDGRWRQKPGAVVRRGDAPGRLEIGFGCHEIGSMPEAKEFHWLNYILFPADPSPEGIEAVRNIFLHPLEVRINEVR